MKNTKNLITSAILAASTLAAGNVAAEDFFSAKADFRLRYENISQDNALDDANALTLRTTISVKSKEINGWSGFVQLEDVRAVLGVDDYNNTIDRNLGTTSVIADPETTELDQGYIQYKSDQITAKIGRQVITLDDHRFVGHVAWRQDKQTFDAASVVYTPTKEINVTAAYVTQRNRIFGEERDLDVGDIFLNASYKTSVGKITAYSYLLDQDDVDNTLDTYGVAFRGGQPINDKVSVSYLAEIATQTSETAAGEFDADFFRFEGGVAFSGLNAKIGFESLGSDDGQFGFSTPLATLHKFNGWTDQFLGTPAVGLEDLYVSLGGKVWGGAWLVRYHDFNAESASETLDELGSELELQYTKKFKNGIYSGIKASFYSADDFAVDEDAVWLWVGKTF